MAVRIKSLIEFVIARQTRYIPSHGPQRSRNHNGGEKGRLTGEYRSKSFEQGSHELLTQGLRVIDIKRAIGYFICGVGAWRSLVAYLNGVQVVAGSNPVAPTTKKSQGYNRLSARSMGRFSFVDG